MGVWASVSKCRIENWGLIFYSNVGIKRPNITDTAVNPINYKAIPTKDENVSMTIKFSARFKGRQIINLCIKEGSYFSKSYTYLNPETLSPRQLKL